MKAFVRSQVDRSIELWRAYEHRLGVGALVVGFLFDLFLAKSPDNIIDNILLLSYLFIAGTIIVLLNLRTRAKMEKEHPAEPLLFLLMLQFCFGGLASNMLVLYGKSGTFTGSALFIALLLCLVFGNEFLRSRYSQLRFNIGVYYFLLLTYCIIAVPTFIFHAIGVGVFLASEILSLIVIALYLAILFFSVLGRNVDRLRRVSLLVLGIVGICTAFYFLNIIPPVPLSLKDSGVYHSILKRSNGDYLAFYEAPPWYQFWRDTSSTFHDMPGDSAYCFSSVYAPADLDAPIYHRWEHYNEATHRWETLSRISFPISGGRSQGYRGWSAMSALTAGDWRCDVETGSGALIGRIAFTVVESATSTELSQTTL